MKLKMFVQHARKLPSFAFLAVLAGLLAACATAEEKEIGKAIRGGSSHGVTVYSGDITRPYRALKKVSEKRRQIPGPNYYDDISGTAWVAALGAELGADAVIKYGSRRIPGKIPLLDPGEYEAWGVAVKFTN